MCLESLTVFGEFLEYLLDEEEPRAFNIWFNRLLPVFTSPKGIAAAVDSRDVIDLKAQESQANLANILNSRWIVST